jgi:predicted component of type VI protein secretion system
MARPESVEGGSVHDSVSEYVLEVVEGPDSGTQVPLGSAIEIGRDPASGLMLDDELVSRRHARVHLENGSVVAEDLGSTNGTFLNGMTLDGAAPLRPGDHLLLGVTVLELRTRRDVDIRPSAVRARPEPFAVESRQPDYVAAAADVPDPRLKAHRLDPLLDVRTKNRARMAPLGLALLVTFAVILFVSLR